MEAMCTQKELRPEDTRLLSMAAYSRKSSYETVVKI